jgi:hypothetical protein
VRSLRKLVTAAAHKNFTTDENGQPRPRHTLWGMLNLAADLAFQGPAIGEIMAQLVRGISDYDSAVTFYDELPPVLVAHPSTRAARTKALPLLTAKIESLEQQRGAQRNAQILQASTALALCLGPVSQFFVQEAVGRAEFGGAFKKYDVLRLRNDIKQLSYVSFWYLLASDALQVESENEAYLLAACWATQSNHT